jgi:hypothetical protein
MQHALRLVGHIGNDQVGVGSCSAEGGLSRRYWVALGPQSALSCQRRDCHDEIHYRSRYEKAGNWPVKRKAETVHCHLRATAKPESS